MIERLGKAISIMSVIILFAILYISPKSISATEASNGSGSIRNVQSTKCGLPLAMGLACGDIILTVAVLAIIITAPLGAALVDATYRRFLTKTGGPDE